MFLGSKEIKRLILEEGLVSGYINLDEQLQPDGFDLTVNKIEKFLTNGLILTNYKVLPQMEEIKTHQFVYPHILKKNNEIVIMPIELDTTVRDIWNLERGVYQLYFNETIRLPKSVSSIHIQRSTLMRCAVDTAIGTWDMGYHGKGCTLLDVKNYNGLILEKNTRVVKMQFVPVGEGHLYEGSYQKENL